MMKALQSPTKSNQPKEQPFSLSKVLRFSTGTKNPPPIGDHDDSPPFNNSENELDLLRQQIDDLKKTLQINKKLISELLGCGGNNNNNMGNSAGGMHNQNQMFGQVQNNNDNKKYYQNNNRSQMGMNQQQPQMLATGNAAGIVSPSGGPER